MHVGMAASGWRSVLSSLTLDLAHSCNHPIFHGAQLCEEILQTDTLMKDQVIQPFSSGYPRYSDRFRPATIRALKMQMLRHAGFSTRFLVQSIVRKPVMGLTGCLCQLGQARHSTASLKQDHCLAAGTRKCRYKKSSRHLLEQCHQLLS